MDGHSQHAGKGWPASGADDNSVSTDERHPDIYQNPYLGESFHPAIGRAILIVAFSFFVLTE
jgi:hypothetical protein